MVSRSRASTMPRLECTYVWRTRSEFDSGSSRRNGEIARSQISLSVVTIFFFLLFFLFLWNHEIAVFFPPHLYFSFFALISCFLSFSLHHCFYFIIGIISFSLFYLLFSLKDKSAARKSDPRPRFYNIAAYRAV